MKKILGMTLFLMLLLATPLLAADVVIEITIRDADVSRLTAAITDGLNCNVVDEHGELVKVLNPEECLKAWLTNHVADLIDKYEERVAKQQGQDAYETFMQNWKANYKPVPIQ